MSLQDIFKEFIVETQENLDKLEKDLVDLEGSDDITEKISNLFRVIHTVKGNAGLLGLSKLEKVAHVGENLLSKLRDNELSLNSQIIDALLETSDAIREILSVVEETYLDGDKEYTELIEKLSNLTKHGKLKNTPQEESLEVKSENRTKEKKEQKEGLDPNTNILPDTEIKTDNSKKQEIKKENNSDTSLPPPSTTTHITESTIRVDIELLDSLVNLVGELVLTRNQVLRVGQSLNDNGLPAALQHLNLVTTELQEGIMQTRMQPIKNAWGKIPRLVRDLCSSCNKKANLIQEGEETELDKSLIEAIKDPITHMIRNSIDHGIETPDEREKKGKPQSGTITLKAYHEGGQVIINISDDGSGIDEQRLKEKALENEIISQDEAQMMSQRDILSLIFLPGMSTAKKITEVSGRGVGMDVVKNNIEKIGGTIDITSEEGKGTNFRIHIPLTLAIIPALIVSSNNQRYAIPQMSLVELVRLSKNEVKEKIETVANSFVYRLRGQLLPLTFLPSVLYPESEHNEMKKSEFTIAVLKTNEKQFGLVVDKVEDNQEIVVKPLGSLLNDINVFAGASILGDGSVALILDIPTLAEKSKIISNSACSKEQSLTATEQNKNENSKQLLLCKSSKNSLCAIQLSEVTRLERIFKSEITDMGGSLATQYRGNIIKLINLNSFFNLSYLEEEDNDEKKELDVIIYETDSETIGLIVNHIVDVVDSSLEIKQPSNREGVSFNATINEHIVEVLDIKQIYENAY